MGPEMNSMAATGWATRLCTRTAGRARPGTGGSARALRGLLLMGFPIISILLHGCRASAVAFPAEPLATVGNRADYDTDGDERADFFCIRNDAGRIDRIGFDRDADGKPDQIVHLDAVNPRLCRHLVLVLDGIPYEVARDFYDAGHLRVFHPPAVVIPPYPVMTDLALEDAFGYMPTTGYEAKYYDRRKRAVVGGTGDYLAGRNEPFVRIIGFRGNPLDDAFVYLRPGSMFENELSRAKRIWDRRESMELVAYFVSSAGLGSRQGREGQIQALQKCERLIHQVLLETGGLVKFTLFADHGQTNVPCKPARLEEHLKGKGWRPVKRLRRDEDVVVIKYGLVTYAAFGTRRPARLIDDLLSCPAVELASYAKDDAVVVRARNEEALIRSTDGKTFEYAPVKGDPLKLADLVRGEVDGRSLLKLTSDGEHPYPDALYRLWRAHFALSENAADVIVSLDDGYYNGAGLFAGAVKMASTHGGLNWRNSATFIMSSAGKIEGPLRSEDIPDAIGRLFSRPFPAGR